MIKNLSTPSSELQINFGELQINIENSATGHIFTDGSKIEVDRVAGGGIYCEHLAHYLSLGTSKSAFDGEVESI